MTAEDALDEKCDMLETIVEQTNDAVFVKDREGRYRMINTAGARLFGRAVAEIVGKRDADLVGPEVAQPIEERDRHVFATGGPHVFEETIGTRTFVTRKCLYRRPDGLAVGLIGIATEITELERVREQFRRAQKMEAVGRLAAGVAHDFNNLLMVIDATAEVLRNDLVSHQNRELIDDILEASRRGAALTQQLLAFSRKQVLEPSIVQVDAVLEKQIPLIRRIIGEDINVVLRAKSQSARVKVDRGQLEQAVLNLVVNARDAMPRGGQLRFETRNADVLADGAAMPAGHYVCLAVSDTGHGVDEAMRARIFDPFFTTKEPGKGTGLGLAMVYGFVTQSGGHIELESEVGKGTTIELYLPRLDDGADPTVAGAAPHGGSRLHARGTETVLVAEDDDPVRALITNALRSFGYEVLEARDGAEAAHVARAHAGAIDVLVTDIVLPHLNGRDVAELMRSEGRKIRVLYMSGYSEEGRVEGTDRYMQKPFRPAELVRRIRALLDAE